jgi:hypothetical protein
MHMDEQKQVASTAASNDRAWRAPKLTELRIWSGTEAKGSQVTESSTTRNSAS